MSSLKFITNLEAHIFINEKGFTGSQKGSSGKKKKMHASPETNTFGNLWSLKGSSKGPKSSYLKNDSFAVLDSFHFLCQIQSLCTQKYKTYLEYLNGEKYFAQCTVLKITFLTPKPAHNITHNTPATLQFTLICNELCRASGSYFQPKHFVLILGPKKVSS